MNTPLVSLWRRRFGDPRLHEFLWYSVPGVMVALVARMWLTASMPYGQYHFDTPDFLQTPYDLLHDHRLSIHNKKTFLVPLLYAVPFLCRVPALIVIPAGQHLMGTAMVLAAGGLCRLWFTFWRWLIVPLTVLTALHPAMLWFEHTLLAESEYVSCVVLLALAGTAFARWPGWETFGYLLGALFFTAGARPEGRLFLAFGILLTLLVYRARLRSEAMKIAALCMVCGLTLAATRTAQAGVLLYASILHLAPDDSRVAPDLMPCLRRMRDRLRHARSSGVPNDVVRTEKRLGASIVECYAPKHPDLRLGTPDKHNARELNAFCLRLAMETARRHPLRLSRIVFVRFLARLDDDTGGQFLDFDLHNRQYRAIVRSRVRNAFLGRGLAGVPLDTEDAVAAFLYAHYDERRIHWYNRWETRWMDAIGSARLPGIAYSANYTLPGLPLFYLVALAGAASSLYFPTRYRVFQWTFLPVLGGVWFTVTLTGAIMPRYRFVLEPFWLLYFCAFIDATGCVCHRLLARCRFARDDPPAP